MFRKVVKFESLEGCIFISSSPPCCFLLIEPSLLFILVKLSVDPWTIVARRFWCGSSEFLSLKSRGHQSERFEKNARISRY